MFCSNQEFLLCGDKRIPKILEKAVSLIIDGYGIKFRYWRVEKDGFLYFYKFKPDNETDLMPICEEDMQLNYYLSIIELYFSSFKYRDTLKNRVFNELAGADGSSTEGWEIVVDNKTIDTKVIIKPYWCFYHK